MSDNEFVNRGELLSLTTEIVAAHVSKNQIQATDLSRLIKDVYTSLESISNPPESADEKPVPAVSIRKSIMPDYLVCLEDGKRLKMLKRHLKTAYGMTPEEYRGKWGLSADYPMVAPNYAKERSKLAKQIGLGVGSSKRGR